MTLRLTLFGPFQLRLADHPPIHFRTNKIRALLAYLATENNHSHTRHTLSTLLWPEITEQRARQNLSQALHRLRKTVNKAFPGLPDRHLHVTRQAVTVLPNSDVFCDSVRFQQLLTVTKKHQHHALDQCPNCLDRLAQAIDLYQGEFLDGFHLRDSVPFEEWMLLRREKYAVQAVQILETLIEAHQQAGRLDLVERYARQQVSIEPWNEPGWQSLIRVLAQSGQRSQALAQFEACQSHLWESLGIHPNEKTIQLAELVREGAFERDEVVDVISQTAVEQDIEVAAQTAVLPTPSVQTHNLPAQVGPFFNRTSEQAQLLTHLKQGQTRWMTLVGEGGVGKTRLAVEVGKKCLEHFADGVWFIPLAGLQDDHDALIEDKLAVTVANILGVQLHGSKPVRSQLLRYLAHKEMLIIFDNFEHVLAGSKFIHSLVQRCSRLTVLCTSREPLQFSGENVLALQGLSTPQLTPMGLEKTALAENDEWCTYPSLQLFIASAERVTLRPFECSEDSMVLASRICCWVGGNPLGIELAASWLRHMTLPEIWKALQESHHFLKTHLRDVPYRHRSMDRVFRQSWELLFLEEQQALATLSAFRGGFTAVAAKAVAEIPQSLLIRLAEHSLVQRTTSGRFMIHEALRQFAEERLTQTQLEQNQHSQMCYYLAFLAAQESKLSGHTPHQAAAQLDAEIPNIRQAWQQAVRVGAYDLLQKSIAPLATYFQLRGYLADAQKLFNDTWQQLQVAASPTLLAQLLCELGRVWIMGGEYNKGVEVLETAVSLLQPMQVSQTKAMAYILQAEASWRQGDYASAQARLDTAYPFVQHFSEDPVAGSFHFHQGVVDDLRGDPAQATLAFQRAVAIWRQLGNVRAEATTLNSLGLVAYHQHQLTEAYYYSWQANQIQRRLGDLMGQLLTNETLGLVAVRQQLFDEARAFFREAQGLSIRVAHRVSEAKSYKNLGWLELEQAQFEAAVPLLEKGLELFQDLGIVNEQAEIWCLLGSVYMEKGAFVQAYRCLNVALMLSQETQNRYTECMARLPLARLYQHEMQVEQQTSMARIALDLATQLQNERFVKQALSLLPTLEIATP